MRRLVLPRVLRLSYSQIQRLRRCPWAWHARHARGLVPIGRKRPPPVWGDAYHVAAAVVWAQRARIERDGWEWHASERVQDDAQGAALARLRELDVPGLDAEALAAEVAHAAVEACRSVGPEWRVLWLGGEPVVERRLVLPLGRVGECDFCDSTGEETAGHNCRECGGQPGVPVELLCVLDLALVHRDTGVVRVVDHKTTTSWPEQTGDALDPAEPLDIDLRDDFQVRLYVLALRHAILRAALEAGAVDLRPEAFEAAAAVLKVETGSTRVTFHHAGGSIVEPTIEGWHLVRRASVGSEPEKLQRGSLSRAKSVEATEEQWRAAIRRAGLREEDYEVEIARSRLIRWQAWARVEFTPRSLDLARREALDAAEDAARYWTRDPDEVPRFRNPSKWNPLYQGRWSGSAPKTDAETFVWAACAACDHRELCVAEASGDEERADLLRLCDFAHPDEAREARAAEDPPPCVLDADEV